jgi:hypothetical protein
MNQEVEILIGGNKVRQIAHEGKIFLIAKEGSEYEIRLKNNSTNRVTGVVSVDGINVIDGEPAVPKGGGYIINGYGSYTVLGFRTSNDEVHPFVFNKKEKSYAAKSDNGDAQDCGVIGAIFWGEKEKPQPTVIEKHIHHDHYNPYPVYPYPYPKPYTPWPYYTWTSGQSGTFSGSLGSTTTQAFNSSTLTSNAASQCSLRAANVMQSQNLPVTDSIDFDMGTQFSKKSVTDMVQTVDFEWGRQLGQIKIYYASREMLKAMGVPVDQAKGVTFPEPFKSQGFCKPPKT